MQQLRASLYVERINSRGLDDPCVVGADLTAALASGAFFGVDPQTTKPANLKGAVFEDTLLSTSDVRTMCTNKTLDFEAKMNLGC